MDSASRHESYQDTSTCCYPVPSTSSPCSSQTRSYDSALGVDTPPRGSQQPTDTGTDLALILDKVKELQASLQNVSLKLDTVLKILGPQLRTVRYYPSQYEQLNF